MLTPTKNQLTDEAMVKLHVPGVRVVADRPSGYRQMHQIVTVTEKAIQFRYYDWLIWAPKRSTIQVRGKREFWVAAWAVDSSKESGYARRVDSGC